MTISEIMGDLLFAPYRIGRLQKDKKAFLLFLTLQIPYFLMPGIFFIIGALVYFSFIHFSIMIISFLDLLINSKKYKYLEDNEYSDEYLELEYPLLEV